MTISERSSAEVTVLDLAGGLTLTDGVGALRERVGGLLQQGHMRLLVNLRSVPDMDSAGLGELVQSYGVAIRQGGLLKLLNAPKHIKDLLVVTKLATIFESFDNEAAAVSSFRAARR